LRRTMDEGPVDSCRALSSRPSSALAEPRRRATGRRAGSASSWARACTTSFTRMPSRPRLASSSRWTV
jgi:hypothetical protein